ATERRAQRHARLEVDGRDARSPRARQPVAQSRDSREASAMTMTLRPSATSPLVGKWFHVYETEPFKWVRWQGQVLAAIPPEVFLVQLYEQAGAVPSTQHLVSLADMLPWTFFQTPLHMD